MIAFAFLGCQITRRKSESRNAGELKNILSMIFYVEDSDMAKIRLIACALMVSGLLLAGAEVDHSYWYVFNGSGVFLFLGGALLLDG